MSSAETALSQEEAREEKLTLSLSRLLMASATFFFAPFFIAFAMLQFLNNNGMWRPKGVTHPSMALAIASVVLLIASGVAYTWGQLGLKGGERGRLTTGSTLALLLAIVAAICYALTLNHMGFGFQSGGYASVFFALTSMYELWLVALCVVLFGLTNRARLGLYTSTRMAAVAAFGEFWWWFIVVGALSYLLLYVIPFLNIEAP